MVGSFVACCPRAASGHATAAEQRDELAAPHWDPSQTYAPSRGGETGAFKCLTLSKP
jgi:hypothetical protein